MKLAGLGCLVGAWFVSAAYSQDVQLLGRTGRYAMSSNMISQLKRTHNATVVMSRCDISMAEEVATAAHSTKGGAVEQIIHSGKRAYGL
jgi:hypothetical protein